MDQRIIETTRNYNLLAEWFENNHTRSLFLVCGKSSTRQEIYSYLKQYCIAHSVSLTHFKDFQPNPDYFSVVKAVDLFRREHCDAIIAIGGGSAMDVAKCIKLYSHLPGTGEDGEFLNQTITPNSIPFLVVPTTAGTGSEATRYAVIYYKGAKQSITDYNCIPDTVILDESLLKSLSVYQRKATMMDAFCHAIESFWSVNSTKESRVYSCSAIEGILKNYQGYLENTDAGNAGMLKAAYLAGKAINITQTTAGHAMCYKITSLFGFAHGHSAALCNKALFPWMIRNINKCCDPRGEQFLKDTLTDLGKVLGFNDSFSAAEFFSEFVDKLGFELPTPSAKQLDELVESVNPVRLQNFPITLDEATIRELYIQIAKD